MKNKLYVLTTATPRAEIHEETCIPVYRTLKNCASFDTTILCNIDVPQLFKQPEWHKAVAKLEPQVDYLYSNMINPSFSLAAKGLYFACNKLVDKKDNNLFLWLEDDWVLRTNLHDFFIEQIEILFKRKDIPVLLTTIYDYVGGNPLLFQEDLFRKIVEVWRRSCNSKQSDPEFIHMQAQSELDGTFLWRMPPINALKTSEPIFLDVGRDWRKKNKIGKLKRERNEGTWVRDELGRNDI